MSERTAALGIHGPAKTIEHHGKTYTVQPVLTHATMAQIEAHVYQKARTALTQMKEDYPPEAYLTRLDALRTKYETGGFSFEKIADQLDSLDGAALVLGCMMDASRDEILELLTAKPAEMEALLNDVMGDSFPKAKAPRKGRPAKKAQRRR